jgi:hypothetical protein
MAQAKSELEKARKHDCLWPTVADAVDTYVRRRVGAHGYERLWRLIHIWESVEITLAAVGITRLASEESRTGDFRDDLRKCRELCYGQSWDSDEGAFKSQQGAFDGSIDRWIDILWSLARLESPPGNFLPKLKAFLEVEAIGLGSFLEVWRNACDVPVKAVNKELSVKECIRHVNIFRNRYAHVPFPPLQIDKIADALEDVTEQLFREKGEENGPEPWNSRGVLTGAMMLPEKYLRGSGGSSFTPPDDVDVSELSFVFTYDQKGKEHEHWYAAPFAHLDASMMNGYILTRLKNADLGTWEYTRFRAETSPVVPVENADWLTRFPPPRPTDYPKPEVVPETPVAVPSTKSATAPPQPARDLTFSEAIDAMRHEEFKPAIEFFRDLVKQKPAYHIGWLKLGISLRERAVRLPEEEQKDAIFDLEESIKALTKATEHIDPEYQASALYERSKARFRLARLAPKATSLPEARKDAAEASKISADTRYFTWVEYLERLPEPVDA